MPTGYTHGVANGEVTTFAQYAKRCARGMGALVSKRDDPLDDDLPSKIEPYTEYYDGKIAELQEEIKFFLYKPDNELRHKITKEYVDDRISTYEYLNENREQIARYNDMLEKVKAWVPPTEDHVNFKKFMTDQLEDSISFDDSSKYYEERLNDLFSQPMLIIDDDVREYRERNLKSVREDITSYEKRRDEEIESANRNTVWIQEMLKSLEE